MLPSLRSMAGAGEVSVEGVGFSSEGAVIAGSLYMPREPLAAVVLVHGSEQTPRMERLALVLAGNGISVLTYDKRGVGQSGGIYAGPEVGTNNIDPANLTLLAKDAGAAVDVLRQRVEGIPVGLVGISQAGWVIPLAAQGAPLVDFMVIFSGPVVTTLEQLRFQFFTEGRPGFWDDHTEAEVREHIRTAEDRYMFEETDPCDALAAISVPGLWIFGGRDTAIPVGLSIERLDSLKYGGKPYEYRLFPSLGHKVVFGDISEPVDIAIRWIRERRAR